ncbi:MBL fold metallo-hydrolase [Nocardioides sp. Iso805N]|uniref:MBL fold metallo-hydrolase n=1 Tax=Nocardioides sp. Iso805N TaxID=1283287 RepID=UPI00036F5FA1|nr:MBL fold metallo-hydrolase [Nocardioides sp. Iso805N]
MKLSIVGCSGSYPGPDSPASCYLVQADDAEGRTWNLLLDLGNGALGALHRYIDPLQLDAILLSHLHADHCIDITSYYVLRKYHPSGSQPVIPIHGPKGSARRLAHAFDLPRKPGMREEFAFHRYRDAFEIGPFTIEPRAVDHLGMPAYGMRITADGATLAYSGDTGPTDVLVELAEGADLFLCEASFREGDDNPPSLHLTGREAGEAAQRAGVKRLVITHVPPWHDAEKILAEAVPVFDGPTELARSGATYVL